MALATPDGKLRASQLEEVVRAHAEDANREHCVQPGMVYLSYPTENGTLYEKQELEAISALCRREGLLLYLDGARLGYGLAAAGTAWTCRALPGFATPSTSAEPSRAPFSARSWWCRTPPCCRSCATT